MGAREKLPAETTRQDPRWPDAHIRLKRLWDERRPPGMSQEDFGAEFGIGNQSMVSQYLKGINPLNIEAAAKFAHGLRCTIKDISPEMDRHIRRTYLPALGLAAWGKVLAMLLLAVLLPAPSEASLHNGNYHEVTLSKSLNKYTLYAVVRWIVRMLCKGFPGIRGRWFPVSLPG